MASPPPNNRKTAIAILTDAPIPGVAQSRFIPVLGEQDAALLQERLTEHAVATALKAGVGPVNLWAAPNASHDTLLTMVSRHPIALSAQPDGDRGQRMHVAATMAQGPVLLITTDCPALTPMHLQSAAKSLQNGADVVLMPNERGGYVLIGLRRAEPTLFQSIPWDSPNVLSETRKRIIARRLVLNEVPPLWDLATEDDLARMDREIQRLALTPGE